MPSDTGTYILLRVDTNNVGDLVDLCKSAEEGTGVECAIIVRRGSDHYQGLGSYVGEFYSTEQAVERMMG